MDLTPHEYYSMTRAEFILKAKGWHTQQLKKWEHTRQISYTIAANAFGRKKRMPSIRAWWPLPTDKLDKPDLDRSEMQAKWEIFKNK